MTNKQRVLELFQQAGHNNELTNHDVRKALPEIDYKAVEDATRVLFKEGKLDRRWDAVKPGVSFGGSYVRQESGRELYYKLGTGEQQLPDECQFCRGAKGGVRGNENIIGGVTVCDYCSVLLFQIRDDGKEPLTSPEPTEDEMHRLNMATNSTLGSSAFYAFKNTPAGRYAAYLLKRWREIAIRQGTVKV